MILFFFFFNDTATTEIYTLSLHDALPISWPCTCIATIADPCPGTRTTGHVVERGDGPTAEPAIDGQPRLDRELLAIDGRQRARQARHVHLSQEPELPQIHAKDRRLLPVGQPHSPQHGPVSAEADEQVAAAAELLSGDRYRGAVQPADFRLEAHDRDLPAGGPAHHRIDRFRRITLGMQNQAYYMHTPDATRTPADHGTAATTDAAGVSWIARCGYSRGHADVGRCGCRAERHRDRRQGQGRCRRWPDRAAGGAYRPGHGGWELDGATGLHQRPAAAQHA